MQIFSTIFWTETTAGRLILFSDRAALYATQATIGLIFQLSTISVLHFCESAGPIVKNIYNLATTLEILVDPNQCKNILSTGYFSVLSTG